MQTQPKKNSNAKITVIIVITLVILAIVGVIVFTIVNRNTKEIDAVQPNVTLFKCHMEKEITDSDINDIKEIIKNAIGDKIIEISKGNMPMSNYNYDEDGNLIDFGDIINITFKKLDESERTAMFNALITKYGLDNTLTYNMYEIHDANRSDIK